MPHKSIKTFAPVAATLLMASTGGHCQAATYPNKRTRLIAGLVPGGSSDSAARIFNSISENEIGQSTALEPLTVKSEYELWGNLFNTINFTAQ